MWPRITPIWGFDANIVQDHPNAALVIWVPFERGSQMWIWVPWDSPLV